MSTPELASRAPQAIAQASEEVRPPWLTDERLRRLEEISLLDDSLATEEDNWILGRATMISGSSGRICLTEKGWRLLREWSERQAAAELDPEIPAEAEEEDLGP